MRSALHAVPTSMLRFLALAALLLSATVAHAQSATDAALEDVAARGERIEDDLDGYVMIEPTVETYDDDGYFTLDLEVEPLVQYFFYVRVPDDETYGSPWVVVEDGGMGHVASAADQGAMTSVSFTSKDEATYTVSVSTQSCESAPCSFVYSLVEVDL